MLPFFAYISIFLLIPTGELIVGAFRTANGAFTFSNISDIFRRVYPQAFEFSLELSAQCAHGRSAQLPGRQRGVAPRSSPLHPASVRVVLRHGGELRRAYRSGLAYIATLGHWASSPPSCNT